MIIKLQLHDNQLWLFSFFTTSFYSACWFDGRIHQYLFLSLRGTLRANDFNSSGSIVTSMMKACLQLVAFVNFVLLFLSCSHVSNCSRLLCLFGNDSALQHCCKLFLASQPYISKQFTEKLELGWGLSAEKEEAGLICCRALPTQGGVTSLSIPMLKQGQCKGFFQQKSSRLACQNRTFSKIKLLLRLAAFIDTLLA